MVASWIERAAALHGAGEAFVLATVVAREAPQSARVGDKAVIRSDGSLEGWIGAGCVRPTVVREALIALAEGSPRTLVFDADLEPGRSDEADNAAAVRRFPMTCQGEGRVEVHLEPIMPRPQLLVLGATPVAEALAAMAAPLGWEVGVAHPKARAAAFSGARITAEPATATAAARPDVMIVVATMGDGDEEALEAALSADTRYIGLVSSRRKAESLYAHLRSQGMDPEVLERITCPAGLDLGATEPAEIAVSILAELVSLRAGADPGMATPADARVARPAAGGSAPGPRTGSAGAEETGQGGQTHARGPVAVVATDPVCGMGVEVDGARHVAEHDGRDFYFCCPHCKAAFEADPSSYAGPAD